jgi:hypothetical protein
MEYPVELSWECGICQGHQNTHTTASRKTVELKLPDGWEFDEEAGPIHSSCIEVREARIEGMEKIRRGPEKPAAGD